MRIVNLKDNTEYQSFLETCSQAHLQQTFSWAEFQKAIPGRGEYFTLGVQAKDKLLATALVTKLKLPFDKYYYYIQRGPLFEESQEALDLLFAELHKRAKQDRAVFLRIDPALDFDQKDFEGFLRGKGFRKAQKSYFPEHTLILDLTQSEEDLLKQMKPKGRYNIRLAKKKRVTVRVSANLEDINHFYKLLQETTSRDGFSGHNKEVYRSMLKKDFSKLYLAEYEGEVLAANLMTYFKDTATYYYGASGNKHRNLMAPYLLQWEAITDAKKEGFEFYDFLGIAPKGAKNHPWAGVTEFKLKFGGKRVAYLPAKELVYKKFWYYLMLLVRKVRA